MVILDIYILIIVDADGIPTVEGVFPSWEKAEKAKSSLTLGDFEVAYIREEQICF